MNEMTILETAIRHMDDGKFDLAVAVLRQSKKKRCLDTAMHLEGQRRSPNRVIMDGLLHVLRDGLEIERALQ